MVGAIGDRVAFYPRHVAFKLGRLTPAQTQTVDVDAVVQHTASGSGTRQSQPWPANVVGPKEDAQ